MPTDAVLPPTCLSDRATQLLKACDEADSALKLSNAVRDLAEAQLVETVPQLVAALSYNNPGAAVAAVDGLIAIGEPAVLPLLELLDTYNYGARAWALRALSGLGDPRALSLLLDTAQNDFALSVRRAAARGLGTIQWSKLEPSARATAQTQVLGVLLTVARDHEWVVRYAAVTGLEALGQSNEDAKAVLASIAAQDTEPAVCARAQLALDRLRDR